MAASVQFRPQNRDLGMVMREVDEDLAIFLGMRSGEKDKNDHFLAQESHEFDDSKGMEEKHDSLYPSQEEIVLGDEKLLNLENEKSDYNQLLMQPDSSSLPPLDMEVQDSAVNQTEISNDQCISSKDEFENSCHESLSVNGNSSSSADSSAAPNRTPLTSENRKSAPKVAKSKPSRASTPASRSMLPSSKAMTAQGRSSTTSTPTSTPASRPSVPVVSKSSSRSSTPTCKPAPPSTTSKSASSRGTSPSVKSRQSKPSDTILSSSNDATQNPRISMPKRTTSTSRTRSSSYNVKPRQKSCSPTKVRAPISTSNKPGSKILTRSRGYGNDGDDVNPVRMGTKMVDRVVNMRKLAPPKQDESVSHDNQRKSSQENSGFGRSLSKKSLDMALRHMDIRLSFPDKLRPMAKGASSSAKSNAKGVSESPPTSSCDSSKSSKSTI